MSLSNTSENVLRVVLSPLPHLWLIDIDGTMLVHNGYLSGKDTLLAGISSFWEKIPAADTIILLSARPEVWRDPTLALLNEKGLRYDHALFGLPTGERILINDKKNSGLSTAISINLTRNSGLDLVDLEIDPTR
jgi:hypothetical protein